MILVLIPFLIFIVASILSATLKNNLRSLWFINFLFSGAACATTFILFASQYYCGNTILGFHLPVYPSQFNLFESIMGIKIAFAIDKMNIVFALAVTLLNFIANLYTIGYMRMNHELNQGSFFSFFNLSILSVLGIAFAKNLFTMFIFYEMLTLFTYPLVMHSRNKESYEAGTKYLMMLIGASTLFLLPAIVFTYHFGGGDFTENAPKFPGYIALLTFLLFNFGIAKSALITVHSWLTAAMVAPAPVSSLLHAVAVVKSGVFILIKIYTFIFVLEDQNLALTLSIISGITILFASISALKAKEVKQVLAYSTISQLSYILMIASLFTIKAIYIAIFYILAHAFAKITLFFSAGSLYTQTHKKRIDEMNGIFRKMPITGFCFLIGSFAMIGLPPTTIFYAKHYIFEESVTLNNYLIPVILTVSTCLTSIYYLKIIHTGFFRKGKNHYATEVNYLMLLPMIITSSVTLALSLFSQKIIQFLL